MVASASFRASRWFYTVTLGAFASYGHGPFIQYFRHAFRRSCRLCFIVLLLYRLLESSAKQCFFGIVCFNEEVSKPVQARASISFVYQLQTPCYIYRMDRLWSLHFAKRLSVARCKSLCTANCSQCVDTVMLYIQASSPCSCDGSGKYSAIPIIHIKCKLLFKRECCTLHLVLSCQIPIIYTVICKNII